MEKIVGVKFKSAPKVYYFAPEKPDVVYKEGEGVIVETSKGQEYAIVVFGTKEVEDDKIIKPLKSIVRKISKKEEEQMKENEKKAFKTAKIAEEKAVQHGLDMKISGAEYSFDGKKIVFYFTSDTRVDFRELVKDLAATFKTRIELHQIGARDETKMFGGLGPCGRPCCCNGCIPDFKKVSIKMAKTQGLSLNPTKISGLCGRLMCCLDYENDYYAEVSKYMPKVGGQIETPEGIGTVVSDNMLKLIVKVKICKPDGSEVYKDFTIKELGLQPENGELDDLIPSCGGCDKDCFACGNSSCGGCGNKPIETVIETKTEQAKGDNAALPEENKGEPAATDSSEPVPAENKNNKKRFDKSERRKDFKNKNSDKNKNDTAPAEVKESASAENREKADGEQKRGANPQNRQGGGKHKHKHNKNFNRGENHGEQSKDSGQEISKNAGAPINSDKRNEQRPGEKKNFKKNFRNNKNHRGADGEEKRKAPSDFATLITD